MIFDDDILECLKARYQKRLDTGDLNNVYSLEELRERLSSQNLHIVVVPYTEYNFFHVGLVKAPRETIDEFLLGFSYPQGFLPKQAYFAETHPVVEVLMRVPNRLLNKELDLMMEEGMFGSPNKEQS